MANILLMVSHPGNRRVLTEALPHHRLLDPDDDDQPPDEVDLVIVDFNRLRQERERLQTLRRSQAPTLVPVLLMLREGQLGRTRHMLGEEVDDVVFTPVLSAELLARLRNLNRLRQLSKSQHERYLASEHRLHRIDRAYRILAACNDAVIHASERQELLEQVLASVVDPKGYLLAWVGWESPDGSDTLDIKAVRGGDQIDPPQWVTSPSASDSAMVATALKAIRQRRAILLKGPDTRHCPFARTLAAEALLAIPLFLDNGHHGVLVIYSSQATAFRDDEIGLLQKLADNLAHGLSALTTRQRLEEQRALAQRRAYRDSLTELPNRQYVKEELAKLDSEAERHQRCAALLFVDLDGFKRINDSLGHAVGDRLLKLVAGRLTQIARGEDFVARLGGDEFVFLIHGEVTGADNPDRQQAAAEELAHAASLLAERLIRGFREPFIDGSHEHRLGASVGISLFPADTRFASDLINWADMAMYKAKSNGGDQFQFYSPSLT
ncbi:MAG: diguanylate cyclase, partial [Marinobacter sp.]|uniref:diguanylate cyclase domain-containing protein n=1 Tax=Marinobacter sp. TaxID=50741 RepID=UPI00299D4D1B